jgi:hypothetical protein
MYGLKLIFATNVATFTKLNQFLQTSSVPNFIQIKNAENMSKTAFIPISKLQLSLH